MNNSLFPRVRVEGHHCNGCDKVIVTAPYGCAIKGAECPPYISCKEFGRIEVETFGVKTCDPHQEARKIIAVYLPTECLPNKKFSPLGATATVATGKNEAG